MNTRRLASIALLGALLGAACGGSDDAESETASEAQECLAAGGHTGPVTDRGTEDAARSAISVEAVDSAFAPTCVNSITAGTVELSVKNTGAILHNVSIADQGVDEDLGPGESVTISVKIGDTPTVYECKYHRTSGMVGALAPQT